MVFALALSRAAYVMAPLAFIALAAVLGAYAFLACLGQPLRGGLLVASASVWATRGRAGGQAANWARMGGRASRAGRHRSKVKSG
jgi:hypothetical protein